MLVLDASALVGWVMPDERGIDLPELAAEHDDLSAPWLLLTITNQSTMKFLWKTTGSTWTTLKK